MSVLVSENENELYWPPPSVSELAWLIVDVIANYNNPLILQSRRWIKKDFKKSRNLLKIPAAQVLIGLNI